jgi:probable HAF family extracellular repeat protein
VRPVSGLTVGALRLRLANASHEVQQIVIVERIRAAGSRSLVTAPICSKGTAMWKLTRRIWLGSALAQLAAGLAGCGGGSAEPGAKKEPDETRRSPGEQGEASASRQHDKPPGRYVLVELPSEFRAPGFAAAVSATGRVVGQYATAKRRNHACVWDSSSFQDLDRPDGRWSGAMAVNRHGHVVGEMQVSESAEIHAFLWNGKAVQDLGTLGGRESHALAINDSGLIAGYATDEAGQMHAVLWRSGEAPVPLEPLSSGFHQAQAVAINSDGMVVGSSFNDRGVRAVIWKDGKAASLGESGSKGRSFAAGLNDHGEVVGTVDVAGGQSRHACLWTGGAFRDLHDLGFSSSARSINRAGAVVGSYTRDKGEERAFLWHSSRMHDLTDLLEGSRKLTLRFALMIDDRGWIAGVGESGSLPVAFLARPS